MAGQEDDYEKAMELWKEAEVNLNKGIEIGRKHFAWSSLMIQRITLLDKDYRGSLAALKPSPKPEAVEVEQVEVELEEAKADDADDDAATTSADPVEPVAEVDIHSEVEESNNEQEAPPDNN